MKVMRSCIECHLFLFACAFSVASSQPETCRFVRQQGKVSSQRTDLRAVDLSLSDCLADCLADLNCFSIDWNHVAADNKCNPAERYEELVGDSDYHHYGKVCPGKIRGACMVAEDDSSTTASYPWPWETPEDCEDMCLTDPTCPGIEWVDGQCNKVDPSEAVTSKPGVQRRIKHTYASGCTYAETAEHGYFFIPNTGSLNVRETWSKDQCITWCVHYEDCSYVDWDKFTSECTHLGTSDMTPIQSRTFVTVTCEGGVGTPTKTCVSWEPATEAPMGSVTTLPPTTDDAPTQAPATTPLTTAPAISSTAVPATSAVQPEESTPVSMVTENNVGSGCGEWTEWTNIDRCKGGQCLDGCKVKYRKHGNC